ncbi:hypothetical protein MM716_35835, partial [Klebsiella pneumoniae]|nr:hypothetical protein [Klebsiella pneumoniae]
LIRDKRKTLKPDGFGVFCIAGAKSRNGGKGAVFIRIRYKMPFENQYADNGGGDEYTEYALYSFDRTVADGIRFWRDRAAMRRFDGQCYAFGVLRQDFCGTASVFG